MTEINKDALLRQATLTRHESWAACNLLMPMERELTLADLWLVIWKRKLVIMLVAASTFFSGHLYIFRKSRSTRASPRSRLIPASVGSLGLDDIISQKLSSGDFDSRLQTRLRFCRAIRFPCR